MTNDTISDIITRLRNANMLGAQTTTIPATKTSKQILRILKQEGFILDYKPTIIAPKDANQRDINAGGQSSPQITFPEFKVMFKSTALSKPILTNLKRISRPGRRIYARRGEIPHVFGGLGVIILSTSRGLLTDKQAQQQGVGGEIVCSVW